MTLLTGAGLLIRTAWLVQHVDPGFSPSHVLASRLLLPGARYQDATSIVRAYHRILEAVAGVPGVRAAALASVVPLSGSSMHAGVDPESHPAGPGERKSAGLRLASSGYFATMGIPLLDGRDIARTDDANAPAVAVISQTLARQLWPGERPIGKRFDALSFDPKARHWIQVVGVVADLHDAALAQPVSPAFYIPFAQSPEPLWGAIQRSLVIVAHTVTDPNSVVRDIRRAVMTVDSSLPLADVHTMDGLLASSLATARFNTLVLSALGLLALVLASIGVYGVVAYYVSQRTHEIGVRLALGATSAHIWRLVLRRGLTPIVGGALAGTLLSLATARLLEGQLFGVATHDPATLGGVAVVLLVVSVLAAYVPARRAMRVAPVVALTAE
jgi:putative ABC transport system permease protein